MPFSVLSCIVDLEVVLFMHGIDMRVAAVMRYGLMEQRWVWANEKP